MAQKQIICLAHAPWRARPDRTQQLLARLGDARILFFEPAPRKGAPMPEQGRRVRAHITVYTLPAPLPGPQEGSMLQRRRLDRDSDFVQQMMDKHRFREPVLWCTSPLQAGFLDRLAYRGRPVPGLGERPHPPRRGGLCRLLRSDQTAVPL